MNDTTMTSGPQNTGTSSALGLTSREALARLASDGPNALPSSKPRSIFRLLGELLREPMILLLIVSASVYVVLGDLGEGLTLLATVVIVIAITLIQEGRTDRALTNLRNLSSPRAQVMRDGVVTTVPSQQLVRGDVIRVAEGDRVPADGILLEGVPLSVDESLLTGESVPVSKTATPSPGEGNDPTKIYSGTLVVAGRGIAQITATGIHTALGQIGTSLQQVTRERTPLQKEVSTVVRQMAIVGCTLSLALVILTGLTTGDWLAAVLSGITLAMSLLPEEFPMVLVVFLALGAWRIAKHRVLTRQMTAIETLGAVHVLCTDKTGTLTQNRMTIQRLMTNAVDLELTASMTQLPESVHLLVEYGILACPLDPFDPMEKAFLALGEKTLGQTEHLHPKWQLTGQFPLSPQLLAVTHTWKSSEDQRLRIATKGAPEAVFDLCRLDEKEYVAWRSRVSEMAKRGLRVLAVAQNEHSVANPPHDPHDVEFELLGLVGLADPLRGDVPDAVAMCQRAKIRLLMITGDHPDTAAAVAESAGMSANEILTGAEIVAMPDLDLGKALLSTNVIARAAPNHKLRIVNVLKAQGQVVAMTGDGVNDAPALKAADIGIAMGKRGTEVAREAASLVLVEDDFASIVDAIRMGRRIFDNLKKAVGYLIAAHIPIAGLALLPILMGWPPIVWPIHIVLLELIVDPACSIVFEMEPEEPDIMNRPPRDVRSRLFARQRILVGVFQGTLVLVGSLAAQFIARSAGASEGQLCTMAFVSLVFGNLAILITNRSLTQPIWSSIKRWNPAVPILVGMTLGLTSLLLWVPAIRSLFNFDSLPASALLSAAAWSVVPVLVADSLKGFVAKR